MKFIKNILVLIFFATQLFNPSVMNATETVIPMNSAECFADGLYQFQSVKVSVGPQDTSYQSGQSVSLVGEIINTNNYPVVDGTLFLRVSKENREYLSEGHEIIDEVKVLEDISLSENGVLPVNFEWQIPKGLSAGSYQFSYFFSVGDSFNLGGLPFTNEIIAGYAQFDVVGTTTSSLSVPRSQTRVNAQPYVHIGNWPLIASTTPIEITQSIQNTSSTTSEVTIKYDLYYWDSLLDADRIESKEEKVNIASLGDYVARYVISQPVKSVYYLKITVSDGIETRIINTRVRTDIPDARINYPALTTFPLLEDQKVDLFSCAHTVFGTLKDTTITMELLDDKGSVIAQGTHTDNLSTSMSAAVGSYIPSKDYDTLTLVTTLLHDNKVIDSYSVTYDCDAINNKGCITLREQKIERALTLLASLLMILACFLFVIAYVLRKQTILKVVLLIISIGILAISFLMFGAVYIDGVRSVYAETTSGDGKTKTETKSSSYIVGWTSGNDSRQVANGNLDYTYTVVLNGSTQMMQGSTLFFTASGQGSYSATGGAWDTPYCGTSQWIDDDQDSWIKFTCTTPTISSVTSSNTSVISCSGVNCTAIGPGTATLTVNLPASTFTMTGCAETNLYGNICHNTNPRNLEFKSGSSYTGGTTKTLATYSPAWTVSVSANGQCGTSNGQTLTSAPTTNLCTMGTASSVTTNTSTYDWTCSGVGVGAVQAICSATRVDVINGQCSASLNTCTAGTFNDLNDSANEYKWECRGVNGGSDSSVCTAPIPEEEQNNGNNATGEPACVSNRETIVAVDSLPAIVLSVSNVDSPDPKFDWISSDSTLNAWTGSYYTVQTNSSVALTGTIVEVRHDSGVGPGGPPDARLTCPAVIVVNPPEAYIDKPIVEATETCTLRWDNVDSSATCIIKNQEGTIIHTIPSGSVTGTHSVDPTDPNNKYFVECEYAESDDTVIGSINSEYVSCIKRGQLQEI